MSKLNACWFDVDPGERCLCNPRTSRRSHDYDEHAIHYPEIIFKAFVCKVDLGKVPIEGVIFRL